jgi:hypothetical protein
VFAASLSLVAHAADTVANAVDTYQQQCSRVYQSNPKFNPVRGKLAVLGFDATAEKIRPPDRVPTDDEAVALKALIPLASRCASLLIQMEAADGAIRWDASPADLNQSAKIWILESSLGGVGGLVLLSEKRLTYADLYDIKKGKQRRMEQEVPASTAAAVPADPRIKLACTLKLNDPLTGAVNSIELQYFINPAANSIWASRMEPPTNIQISETLISFQQGTTKVNISRITGALEQISSGNGVTVMFNGTCQPIGAPKF